MDTISKILISFSFLCPLSRKLFGSWYVEVFSVLQSRIALKSFSSPEGDHLTLLNVYRASDEFLQKSNLVNSKEKAEKNLRKWCKENFINSRSLKHARDIHRLVMSAWPDINGNLTVTWIILLIINFFLFKLFYNILTFHIVRLSKIWVLNYDIWKTDYTVFFWYYFLFSEEKNNYSSERIFSRYLFLSSFGTSFVVKYRGMRNKWISMSLHVEATCFLFADALLLPFFLMQLWSSLMVRTGKRIHFWQYFPWWFNLLQR